MAGHGGARAGAGRPKGSTNGIAVEQLKAAFVVELGIPFEVVLARMGLKLYQDFQNNENVDSAVRFFNRAGDRMVQALPTLTQIEDITKDLTKEDIDNRINNLLSRAALSVPYFEKPPDNDETHGETH